MRINSELLPKQYLSAMKARMGSHTAFGSERFTGFFFGPVFSVTYHSGHEWNRRITNEKNTAIGIVKKAEDGSSLVRFIRVKGFLAPPLFLVLCLTVFLVGLIVTSVLGGFNQWPLCLGLSILFASITAVGSAAVESLTERSYEGYKVLTAFLYAPGDPFSYINHKDKV